MTTKATDNNQTIEPEVLGVELSEVLKNSTPEVVTQVISADVIDPVQPITVEVESPVKPTEEVKTQEVKSEEIVSDQPVASVPKKEFSMPEQVDIIEDIVESYVSNPVVANSSR